MKKLFTLLILAIVGSAAVKAADYSGKLKVTVNGMPTVQDDVFTVNDLGNGKYTLLLKNFRLSAGDGNSLAVGNIEIADVEGLQKGDITVIDVSREIVITSGDDPNESFWMGPMLGKIPVDLKAEIYDDHLYAYIYINLKSMNQIIEVEFNDRAFQIPNSGFETFHQASVTNPSNAEQTVTSDEPNNWHSFMSSTSNGLLPLFAWMAVNTPHTFISTEVCPGSEGKSSLLLTSSSILGIVANGTITTGRINTGAVQASDMKNNSYSDITITDVDANGDAFYSRINGRPDSLVAWVKFKQSTPDEQNPYATIKAVITDGTYFQDPEDKDYNNVLARAVDNTIESNGFVWQRLSVPFEYTANASSLTQRIVHVTASTNATPGEGSIDSLYIDDVSLVYNCGLSAVNIKGELVQGFDENIYEYTVKKEDVAITDADVEATSTGAGAIVEKNVSTDENATVITITVTSNDLLQVKTYTIKVEKDKTDGITSVAADEMEIKAVYTVDGIKVNTMQPGNVYIVEYTDGTTRKLVKK